MSVLEIDTSDAMKQLANMRDTLALVPGGMHLACQRAANKSIKSLKVAVKKSVLSEYSILSRDLEKSFSVVQASKWNPNAELHASGNSSISLSHFNPRARAITAETKTRSGGTARVKRTGVTVKVKKTGGRKLVKGGFQLKAGAIMKRVGDSRLPIAKLYGPSPLRLLEDSSVQHELQFKVQELMEKNLEHEATHILRQAGLR
ncbi:phage tail protein [Maridesulfovibrio ferrireducens]|uniref:phage tail protein n=1 Tax=Maridesulfovibrio ferrireducens TaxID=246191 RepID=UPI001A2C01CF|nr:phage tail protein [Maridesulfovibrio ferrireducens]MBI9112252.1 phage tail protein [Maridesulfovibrio ferrireducens]